MRRLGSGPQGALRPERPGAWTTDTPTREHPHPPGRAPRDPGARQTQARRAQTRTHKHGGARTRQGTAAAATRPQGGHAPEPEHAHPQGGRSRRAPLLTFMSLTMAWKSPPRAPHSFSAVSMLRPGGSGGGGAQAGREDPGRGGAHAEGGPGLPPPGRAQRPAAPRSGIAGRRGAAWAMSRRGWQAAWGARRGQLAAQPRRGDWSGGRNPSRRGSGVTWAHGGRAAGREGGAAPRREGAVGKAGPAPAHSPPGARALKSEPGHRQTGRASGSGGRGRGRHRGSGTALGGVCPAPSREWDPWLSAHPLEGAQNQPPSFGLGPNGGWFQRFYKRAAGGRGPSGAILQDAYSTLSRGARCPGVQAQKSLDPSPEVLWLLFQAVPVMTPLTGGGRPGWAFGGDGVLVLREPSSLGVGPAGQRWAIVPSP